MAKQDKSERMGESREAMAAYQASRKVSLDSVLANLVNGPSAAKENGGSGLIDKRSDQTYIAGVKVAQEHIDWDSVLSRAGKQVPQGRAPQGKGASMYNPAVNTISLSLANKAMETFQPVVNELNKFKFASSTDKRDEQMEQIYAAVKEAVQRVAVKEVAANTKRFYDNAVKFANTGSGMRVTYKVANNAVVVTAEGDFYGDEIVCLEQDGGNATAYVARHVDGEFEDITGRFAMKLELGK